jgi:hypothetical protein
MLNSFFVFALAVVINLAHFFIPAKVYNPNFDPILSALSLIVFLSIIHLTSSLRKDFLFIILISLSLISQISSYYLNGGRIPDYIDLYLVNSNLPDFMISFTILTWWYYRVYKQPEMIPAKIEQDA